MSVSIGNGTAFVVANARVARTEKALHLLKLKVCGDIVVGSKGLFFSVSSFIGREIPFFAFFRFPFRKAVFAIGAGFGFGGELFVHHASDVVEESLGTFSMSFLVGW